MRIVKKMNNMVSSSLLLCLVMMLSGCTDKSEPIAIDPEKLFQDYDERYWSFGYYGVTSYDIREIEKQIDGFWNYYNEYEKSRQALEDIIMNWEADFLTEGTYIVGQDIQSGWYVFCNPTGDDNDDENAICRKYSIDSTDVDIWRSPHYEQIRLEEGQVVKVKGTPKFAYIDEFPVFIKADDGNYYGAFYQIGKDIPEGKYFSISMNISDGIYNCYTKNQVFGTALGIDARYAANRFSYVNLTQEDEYVCMWDCVLIPIEQKPEIQAISHEDISDWDKKQQGKIKLFNSGKQGQNYEQPIYAEGEYIIGEDIPLGKYSIQDEIAVEVNDLESEKCFGDYAVPSYSDEWYSWTGLVIPYEEDIQKCGWQFMRTSRWIHRNDIGVKYVEIKDMESISTYQVIEENNLPFVEFDKSDEGCVVRVVRAILIPQQ